MPSQVPSAIHGQNYISLTTFRKTGAGVATPVWFGEEGGKLYVMTRSDMGKTKRIRNNPQVRVAPCTIGGKVTGAEVAATARILSVDEHARARKNNQSQVLDGADSAGMVANRYVPGNQLRVAAI